jgi:biopolymer transport protein ExbD
MATDRVPEEPQQDELPMTPMIDVIFQLVIFFMCSGHFKQIEGKLMSYLPPDKGFARTVDDKPPSPELRIRLVRRDQTVTAYLEGRPMGQFPAEGPRLEGISSKWDRIAQEAAPFHKANIRKDPRAYLSIDAGPKVPFQYVVSTLDACRRAGIQKIEFAGNARVQEQVGGQR